MRRPVIFVVLAVLTSAVLVLANTAAAAPSKTKTINATLVSTACDDGRCGSWRCGASWGFSGRGVVAPRIGAVDFDGFYANGCVPGWDPPTWIRHFTLTLVSGNGDKLVLAENVSWLTLTDPVPPQTWAVDETQSTGRFATYSGSGNYTVDIVGHGTYATITVELSGTLTSSKEADVPDLELIPGG